jgi:guanylate kinase
VETRQGRRYKTHFELPGEGKLFIVSAPSGAGKTTLCRKLTSIVPRLKHSVSYTTRPRRKGEKNNVDYTFISEKKFKAMINRGEFVEWAVVHGNLYGTSLKRLRGLMKKGYDIILDIDVQGVLQVQRKMREAVYIFILPPSIQVLKKRLTFRMSDTAGEIEKRVKKAREEILSYRNYDFIVINDDLRKALKELESIVISKRLKANRFKSALLNKAIAGKL